MDNVGTLEVSLLDVAGGLAQDPATRVTIRRGTSQEVLSVFNTSFRPARKFELPAFPTEHVLSPLIEPTRFRSKPLPFFALMHGKTVVRNVTRLPAAFRVGSLQTSVHGRDPSDRHPRIPRDRASGN